MGLGRIPWHESARYAEYNGFDEAETQSLIELVDRLDLHEHSLNQKDKPNGRQGPPSTRD